MRYEFNTKYNIGDKLYVVASKLITLPEFGNAPTMTYAACKESQTVTQIKADLDYNGGAEVFYCFDSLPVKEEFCFASYEEAAAAAKEMR